MQKVTVACVPKFSQINLSMRVTCQSPDVQTDLSAKNAEPKKLSYTYKEEGIRHAAVTTVGVQTRALKFSWTHIACPRHIFQACHSYLICNALTGDWKIDDTPLDGVHFDRTAFDLLGDTNVAPYRVCILIS